MWIQIKLWVKYIYLFFQLQLGCTTICKHGGVLNEEDCSCECKHPWSGPQCESLCFKKFLIILECTFEYCKHGGELNVKECKCICPPCLNEGIPAQPDTNDCACKCKLPWIGFQCDVCGLKKCKRGGLVQECMF